ncbi:hypothetical protein BBJ28_00011936 [Nothophytophthora sp. Chile5]|nr:hypothetical protein BBJ28_00011936 [Nothophytophthora sp. Chile5]
MVELTTTLNAKERRKLQRLQQREDVAASASPAGASTGVAVVKAESAGVKKEENAETVAVKSEAVVPKETQTTPLTAAGGEKLNKKQRRKLQRRSKRKTAAHDKEEGSGKEVVTEAADGEKLNARQRRQLQRQSKQQPTVDDKKENSDKEVAAEAAVNGEVLNAKQRRQLQRQAKQQVSADDQKEESNKTEATVDGEGLNAKQRRLLQRKATRKAEGIEEKTVGENEKETVGTKRKRRSKRSKTEEVGEDGEPVAKRKSIHLTLFVGQLPFKATEAMVRRHFQEAGDIQVRMLTDKKTKRFKGTAFIEVKDSKALGAALSRHHTLLAGRRINVELTASGGGNNSEQRRTKIDLLRKKQSNVQAEKTKALLQKHIDGPEYKMQKDDVDERMIDFLSWFDYETAKNALNEYNRCVGDRVQNRKAFFMGILKRFRQTDGEE